MILSTMFTDWVVCTSIKKRSPFASLQIMSNTHPLRFGPAGSDSLFMNCRSTISDSGLSIRLRNPMRFGFDSSVPNMYLNDQSKYGLITLLSVFFTIASITIKFNDFFRQTYGFQRVYGSDRVNLFLKIFLKKSNFAKNRKKAPAWSRRGCSLWVIEYLSGKVGWLQRLNLCCGKAGVF